MGNADWKCRMGKWNGKLKIRNEFFQCFCFGFIVYNELQIFYIDIHVLFQRRSRAKVKDPNKLMKRKEVSVKEQIMSKKKYISITFTQNSGYCVSHSSIFNNAREKKLRTVYCFLFGMFSFGSSLVRPYEQTKLFL